MKDFKLEGSFYKDGKRYVSVLAIGDDVLEKLIAQDVPTARTFLNDFVHFIKSAQNTESLV